MWDEQEDAMLDDEVEKNSYEYERMILIEDYINKKEQNYDV